MPLTVLFGGPVLLLDGRWAGPSVSRRPADDIAFNRQCLREMEPGGTGLLRVHCPPPTAAFSGRDQSSPGYAAAALDLETRGFAPVIRGPGGHLAVYDEGAVVIDLIAPHADPRGEPFKRFEILTTLLVDVFRTLGIDACAGPIADEFCPGSYSVNIAGRYKVAGLAQRLGKCGYHLGAVIMAGDASRCREAMASAYPKLGLRLDPRTVGSIADDAPDVTPADVQASIIDRLRGMVDVSSETLLTFHRAGQHRCIGASA